MNANSIHHVEEFLSLPRVALVGASHNPRDFSRVLMAELVKRGYDVVPVNLRGGRIDDREAATSVSAIAEPVDWALVMVPASAAADVVEDCARAGVRRVWLHRGAGLGSASAAAAEGARRHEMTLVHGECPFMFLGAGGPHAVHNAIRRLGGAYPAGGVAPREGWVTRALAAIQLLVGLSALVAGFMLILDPSGATLGLSAGALSGPFGDFLVPGIVLLAVNGAARLRALALTARRRPGAPLAAVLLGVFLVLWVAAQWLWLTPVHWMQFVTLALGGAEIALGLRLVRRAPAHKSPPRPTGCGAGPALGGSMTRA